MPPGTTPHRSRSCWRLGQLLGGLLPSRGGGLRTRRPSCPAQLSAAGHFPPARPSSRLLKAVLLNGRPPVALEASSCLRPPLPSPQARLRLSSGGSEGRGFLGPGPQAPRASASGAPVGPAWSPGSWGRRGAKAGVGQSLEGRRESGPGCDLDTDPLRAASAGRGGQGAVVQLQALRAPTLGSRVEVV